MPNGSVKITTERRIIMKTTRNYIITLALAVSFLVAANVRADLITFYGNNKTNVEAYFTNAQAYDIWNFGNFEGQTNDNTFVASNGADSLNGRIVMSNTNGNGGGYNFGNASEGTIQLAHNTARTTTISFDYGSNYSGSLLQSFYFTTGIHDNASYGMSVIAHGIDADGKAIKYTDTYQALTKDNLGFWGFTIDEGYFTSFEIQVTSGNGNGGLDDFWIASGAGGWDNPFNPGKPYIPPTLPPIGDGPDAATPEPATLAMLGLGLAGLGIARRRMKK